MQSKKQFDLPTSKRCGLLLGRIFVCRVAGVLQPFLLLCGSGLLLLLHGGFIANTSKSYNPKRYCDTHMWIALPLLGQLWYDGS